MKSLFKPCIKIFLTIIIFCNLFFVFGASFTYAADKNLNDECAPGVDKCLQGNCMQDTATAYHCLVAFKPQIEIPGVGSAIIKPGNSTEALGNYIKGFYSYAVGITAILATTVLMIGGFQWIIAGGSGEKIGEAKAWITAALSGLVLALSSYMILNLVNPALVNFKVKDIKVIKAIDPSTFTPCCTWDINAGATIAYVTSLESLFENCSDGDKTMTDEKCADKATIATAYRFVNNGKCEEMGFMGTSFLSSWRCASK